MQASLVDYTSYYVQYRAQVPDWDAKKLDPLMPGEQGQRVPIALQPRQLVSVQLAPATHAVLTLKAREMVCQTHSRAKHLLQTLTVAQPLFATLFWCSNGVWRHFWARLHGLRG